MINTTSHNSFTLKALLLEDNTSLAEEMMTFLSKHGIAVTHCTSIMQLDTQLTNNSYQLLILDRLLPEGDSLDYLDDIKKQHHGCIIVLSALGMSNDRVSGLNAGADYYLAKPVDLDELLAVINAVSRKSNNNLTTWYLSEEKKSLFTPNHNEISLTGSEFNLLKAVMNQPNTILTREVIVQLLGFDRENYDVRRLDTLVCRLRGKVRNESDENLPIHTFSKVGYSWKVDDIETTTQH
jgi:DNA-binding response OmpR family regulator